MLCAGLPCAYRGTALLRGAAVPFSSTSIAAAGDAEQVRGPKKSPQIALLAHYNFAECVVGGQWHA
jgi:hypothetical protein